MYVPHIFFYPFISWWEFWLFQPLGYCENPPLNPLGYIDSIYPKFLDHMIVLFLIFWGNSILFSIVSLPIYILNNHAQGLQFLHILDNTGYFLNCFFFFWCVFYFKNDHPNRCEMGYLFFHVAFLHVAGVGQDLRGRKDKTPVWIPHYLEVLLVFGIVLCLLFCLLC